MPVLASLQLASRADAHGIACLSRDQIEQGLRWSWTPARVLRSIEERDACVLVARSEGAGDSGVAGFAILHFGEKRAHLNLLAVAPAWRRHGIGRRLIDWLTVTAEVAGIRRIELELREANTSARAFYEALGFKVGGVKARYYDGREAALSMWRSLGPTS